MSFTLTANHNNAGAGAVNLGTCTSGNLVVVGLFNTNGNVTLTSLSDTLGSTWHFSTVAVGGNGYAFAWAVMTSTGANSLTNTWSDASSGSGAAYAEFTGTSVAGASQDGTMQIANGSGATSTTSPAVVTSGTDDLAVNFVYSNSGAATFAGGWSTAVSAGFTGLAYKADVAAGTYNPSATFPSSVFGSLGMAIAAGALHSFTDSGSGAVTYGGVATEFFTGPDTGSGNVLYTGSRIEDYGPTATIGQRKKDIPTVGPRSTGMGMRLVR
jgi:hypothetical protein